MKKLLEAQPWNKHVSSVPRLDSLVQRSTEYESNETLSVYSRQTADALQQYILQSARHGRCSVQPLA